MPEHIAFAAWTLVNDPLKESGAITIFNFIPPFQVILSTFLLISSEKEKGYFP
jgi:hypothetical protein